MTTTKNQLARNTLQRNHNGSSITEKRQSEQKASTTTATNQNDDPFVRADRYHLCSYMVFSVVLHFIIVIMCCVWIRIQFMRFLCYFCSFAVHTAMCAFEFKCVRFGKRANDITKSLSFAARTRFSGMCTRIFIPNLGRQLFIFVFFFRFTSWPLFPHTHKIIRLWNASLMRFCGRFCFLKFIII